MQHHSLLVVCTSVRSLFACRWQHFPVLNATLLLLLFLNYRNSHTQEDGVSVILFYSV